MNFSANVLGLDNAATPLGLKAMSELQEINPQKDTASNAMIMFLVLNTAGITLIPTSVIAMRQALAMKQGLIGFNAADIFLPTLLATFISFCAGLITVSIWQRINLFCKPVLTFFAGFFAFIGLLYAWLSALPAEQSTQMIGLLWQRADRLDHRSVRQCRCMAAHQRLRNIRRGCQRRLRRAMCRSSPT